MQTKDEIAGYYPVVIEKMKEWAAGSGALIIGSTIYKEEGKFYNRLLAVFLMDIINIMTNITVLRKEVFLPEKSSWF